MFFVFFADMVMSYASPIFIEHKMNSTLLMGLILSSSSVFGLLTDLLLSKQFAHKEYRFFARWLIALALFFPVSLLIMPAQPLTFLFAMAVWGMYFECIGFSQFNFVHTVVNKHQHTAAWGVLETFKAVAAITAPIAATYLLAITMEVTMYAVIASLMVALVSFFFYRRAFPERPPQNQEVAAPRPVGRGFWQELRIWRTLFVKIWPVYLFFFAFVLLEATLWTVGPLLSETIRQEHPLSGFLLSAYVLPSVVTPSLAVFLSKRFSKKRVAFIAAAVGASILGVGSLYFGHSPWLPVIVFCSALFFSLDYPEIEAVFEDYISRIDGYGNDLIGLQSTASSLAYIVGPVLAGALATWLGLSATIGAVALFFGAVAVVALIVTPRKIRMPHQELAALASDEIAVERPADETRVL